ncbi:MAG: hypothetical protein GC171_07185 [Terrimonas sp.]|nr:hypothetical protein [Terrimonas sp.]
MQKYFLFIFLIMGRSLFGQVQEPKTPFELNETLAGISDSLYTIGVNWGNAFNEANQSGDFSAIKTVRVSLEKYIDTKITYVSNMKDVKNSKAFRLAILDFLNYEKSFCDDGLKPFENLDSKSSDADKKKLLDQLTPILSKEENLLKAIAVVQKKYAEENGFTIQE